MKIRAIALAIISFIICGFLVSCKQTPDVRGTETPLPSGITTQDYRPAMDGYATSYLGGANTSGTTDEMKILNMLYLPDGEDVDLEFGVAGSSPTVIMKLYYDYQPIAFKPTEEEIYADEYVFKMEDGTKTQISISLDKDKTISDNKIHKLLITFTTGYHQKAMDFDRVTDEYGISLIYDVVSTPDYSGEVYIPFEYEATPPEDNFDKNISNLIFNFDYENSEQLSSGGIRNPLPKFESEGGISLPMMYNVMKNGADSALLLLTLNFNQIDINGEAYKLIRLDGKEGMANGKLNFNVPNETGDYDIIGYVILRPFEKIGEGSNMVYTSPRFTLSTH